MTDRPTKSKTQFIFIIKSKRLKLIIETDALELDNDMKHGHVQCG
jgi:hypothetical protein